MQRTMLIDGETIILKILSGLAQTSFLQIYLYLTSFDWLEGER